MAYRLVGRLVFGYDADTTKFEQGTGRMRRSMGHIRQAFRRLRQSARRVGASLRNFSVIVTGLNSAFQLLARGGAITRTVKEAADYGAGLKEVSLQIGIQVDRLLLWQRAFEGNGVAADKANKSLVQFARAMSEAHEGSAEYLDSFDRLGVKLTDADGNLIGVEEALLRVADGFAKMDNATQRAADSAVLFGGRNSRMLVTLMEGRAALVGQIEAYREFGLITDRQATDLKALDQSYTNLANTWKSVVYGAVADNIDIFKRFVEETIRFVREWGPRFVEALKTLAEHWDLILIALGSVAALITGAILAAMGPAGWLVGGIIAVTGVLVAFAEEWRAVATAIKEATMSLDEWARAANKNRDAMGMLGFAGADERSVQEGAVKGPGDPKPPTRITIGRGRGTAPTPRGSEMGYAIKEVENFGTKIVDLRTPLDKFRERALEVFEDWRQHMKSATDSATDFGRHFADITTSAVDQIVDGIAEGSFEIKGFLRGLLADILKVTLRATIMRNILEAGNAIQGGYGPLGSFLANLFGTAGAAYGQTGGEGGAGLIVGPGGALGGGVAEGGPVRGGTRYLVGERGPELFVPSRDGHVVSSEDLAARFGGGGGVINFAPVIQGQSDPTLIRAEIERAYPRFQEAILATQNRRANRPSNTRQSLRG